jgi:gas vesicle protein
MNGEMVRDYNYKGNGGSAFFTFLTGALIGVGLGMLFAPKAGSETRRQLADMARNAQEKAADVSQRMKRRTEEGMNKMRDTMNRDTMGA